MDTVKDEPTETRVDAELKLLDKYVESLELLADELSHRLRPIMTPFPEAQEAKKSCIPKAGVEILDEIGIETSRILDVCSLLKAILDNLVV